MLSLEPWMFFQNRLVTFIISKLFQYQFDRYSSAFYDWFSQHYFRVDFDELSHIHDLNFLQNYTFQLTFQKLPRPALFLLSYRLRRAGAHNGAAAAAAFGADIHDVIGHFDHVEVVLDHDDGVAFVHEFVQYGQQLADVFEVQARGGFVEDIYGATGVFFAEFFGEFYALGFAAAEGGRLLAEGDVAEADVLQGF
jgi:hypothetical protein